MLRSKAESVVLRSKAEGAVLRTKAHRGRGGRAPRRGKLPGAPAAVARARLARAPLRAHAAARMSRTGKEAAAPPPPPLPPVQSGHVSSIPPY